jgi:hypothetical protein
VSRQCYWPEGRLVVEIASGGIHYANAGMLITRYRGEGEVYADPVEAAEAAIAICKLWRKELADGLSIQSNGKRPMVAHGCTGGMDIPFEPESFTAIRKWAKTTSASLPRCPHCNDIMPSRKSQWRHPLSDDPFCSENCCNLDHEHQQREDGANLYDDEGK